MFVRFTCKREKLYLKNKACNANLGKLYDSYRLRSGKALAFWCEKFSEGRKIAYFNQASILADWPNYHKFEIRAAPPRRLCNLNADLVVL